MLFTPLPQVDFQRVERTKCSVLASDETVTGGERLGSWRRRTLWPLQVGQGGLFSAAGLRWGQVLSMPHGSGKKGPSIFGKLDLGTDSPESWNRESKQEILAGEFQKVPEQKQGVWEAGC